MAGRTIPVDLNGKGKAVLPILLTVLAGLGGGIFAMRPDAAPNEPGTDDFTAPTNAAETPRSAEPVVLTAPDFSTDATLAERLAPKAADRAIAAPIAAGDELTPRSATNLVTVLPSPKVVPDAVEALPVTVAVNPPADLPRREQPAAVAPVPLPAVAPEVAIIAVPVVQPANGPSSDKAEVLSSSQPAAELADNAGVASVTTDTAPESPALAAAAVAPEAAPLPQLAIADWNYSLPDPSAPSGANAFAGAAQQRADYPGAKPGNAGRTAQRATAQSRAASAANRTRLATPAGKVPAAVGNRKIAGAGFASSIHAKGKYQFVGSEIEFQLPVVANGAPVGNLTLHVAPNQQVSLRLRELLTLFHDQIDPQQLSELVASPSIDSFVTFDKLRDAGIDIRYDAGKDRISLSVEQP